MSLFYFTHTEPEFQGNIDDKYGYWFTFALFEYFVLYIFAETLLNKCRSFQGEMYVMSVMLLMSVVSFYYEQVRYAPSFITWCTLGSLLSFAKMKYVVFFWMGSFVKKYFSRFTTLTNNQYFMAVIIVFFTALANASIGHTSWPVEYLLFMVLGASGVIILFTFFRRYQSSFVKEKVIGRCLQYIGRRTLDIYLLHYFFLPYGLDCVGKWLNQQPYSDVVNLFVGIMIALWVITICLLVSNVIRLSPFLGHYLFGVKRL